jgi:hypothetical protein
MIRFGRDIEKFESFYKVKNLNERRAIFIIDGDAYFYDHHHFLSLFFSDHALPPSFRAHPNLPHSHLHLLQIQIQKNQSWQHLMTLQCQIPIRIPNIQRIQILTLLPVLNRATLK